MSRKPDVQVSRPSLPPAKAEEIRILLERVVGSHHFRGSHRCVKLLRHITEMTLGGETQRLKERTLGVEVFERAPDYDTNQDPVVRSAAAEIRKKLAQFYQESGREIEPRIELVAGSYVAEFHFREDSTKARLPPARRALVAGGAAALTLSALAVAVLLLLASGTSSDLDHFWAPLIEAPGSVFVSTGQPAALVLKSARAQDAIQGSGGPPEREMLPKRSAIPMSELLILPNRFLALGDAVCLVRLTSLLERLGKPFRIRGERSTSYADLSEGPAVLIGAFNNQWTARALSELRFTFVKDYERKVEMVRDRQAPENTDWRLEGAWPRWDVPQDYAIVSRIVDVTSGSPVVVAAGITDHGTMAAGEFLSNREYFTEAVTQLPNGWRGKKNLQIVLLVPVENRVTGRPRVLATHAW